MTTRKQHRVGTLLIATALATGGMTAGTMVAASAHHPAIVVAGTCDTSTGLINGTVTIRSDADYNKDWGLDSLTMSPAITVNGLTFDNPTTPAVEGRRDDQVAFVGTFTGVAPGTTLTATAVSSWYSKGSNTRNPGNVQNSSDPTKLTADCKKEVPAPGQPQSSDACNPPGVTDNVTWVPETGPADTPDVDWTYNTDTSLTAKPQPGKKFSGQQQVYTFTRPKDSGTMCPVTTPPPPPPVPPTVYECPSGTFYAGDLNHNGVMDLGDCQSPPVPPKKLVYGKAYKLDKCGTAADRYGVKASRGVIYKADGKRVKREGQWLKTHGAKRIVVKAHAADGYELAGPRRWVLTYKNGACSQPPVVSPPTGAERVA